MSKKANSFEDLWIWQQARILVKEVYSDFGNETPSRKDFGFRDQIQRSAISIMNNIAEGFERSSDVEFARFLEISKASCGEVRSMCYTAEDLTFVKSKIAIERRLTAKQIAGGIASLRRHLKGTN